MASFASSMFSNVTKPKPLDLCVSLSFTTTTGGENSRRQPLQHSPAQPYTAQHSPAAPRRALTFRDLPVFGEDLLQRLLVGVKAQPSDEQLALIRCHRDLPSQPAFGQQLRPALPNASADAPGAARGRRTRSDPRGRRRRAMPARVLPPGRGRSAPPAEPRRRQRACAPPHGGPPPRRPPPGAGPPPLTRPAPRRRRSPSPLLPPAAILHGRGPSPFCFRGAPQRSSGPLLPAANRPGGRTALPAAAQGLAARGGPTPGRGTARTPPTSGTRCPRCPAPSPPSSPTADRCPPRTSAGAYRRSEPQKPHNTSKPQRDERGGWRGGGLYTPAPGPALLMNMQICPHRGAERVTPPKRRRCAST